MWKSFGTPQFPGISHGLIREKRKNRLVREFVHTHNRPCCQIHIFFPVHERYVRSIHISGSVEQLTSPSSDCCCGWHRQHHPRAQRPLHRVVILSIIPSELIVCRFPCAMAQSRTTQVAKQHLTRRKEEKMLKEVRGVAQTNKSTMCGPIQRHR